MADQKQRRMPVDDRVVQDLDVLVTFLDPHLAAKAKKADKAALWPWRKTVGFILVASLIGWSLVLGLVYLLYRLFQP